MKCIAVGNKKGGVGKSTIAIHLGGEFSLRNHSVTLYDADEQGTATNWCARGKFVFQCKSAPIEHAEQAKIFINQVKSDQSDIVIIDLPPHTREATEAAIAICDLFVIPVTPSGADFTSTGKALSLVHEGRSYRNGAPKALLVPSRVDRRTAFGKEISESLSDFQEIVGPEIGQRSAFIDSFGLASWVGNCDPKSKAYKEIQLLTDKVEEMLG